MEPAITSKAWNPDIEVDILQRWAESDVYGRPEADSYYTIDTPPPYPSGRPWHIGAAAHYSQIDMIARTARMEGRPVYFPIGIDRNGLPVEIYTEKKHHIRMKETPRDVFLEMCREALDELESEMVTIMQRLGLSGEIDTRYHTDTAQYRAVTQATFIQLWNEGRIYLATRPNNYDWVSGTTIADAEIVYQDIPSRLVHMRFDVEGGDDIIIASTRPELLCSCQALIVNPEDTRYYNMIGKRVRVPIYGHHVKVMAHHSARADFGSGVVMVCSYGDQNDVSLFRELKLAEIISVGLDGRMSDAAGKYAGLRPKQARQAIIQDLQDAGVILKIDDITHRTPVSERSKTPIEIVPMDEYYMKQLDRTDILAELSDGIRFHPDMHRQILLNWLDSITIDWPISRRRYYGTEIPIWYCDDCGEPHVPEPGPYYRPWQQEAPMDMCGKCGSDKFTGEERTFDTWMDSSISPLFIAGYGKDDALFAKAYPADVRPQSKDIVRTWLYYTLLRCHALTGEKPWHEAWIMGYGLDERGLKMSKSRGNSIDPLPVIEKYGADSFRLWSASEVNLGYDFRCNEQKIAATKKFLSKLWNIARFVSAVPVVDDTNDTNDDIRLNRTDHWILDELNGLVARCRRGYADYNFFVPAVAVREFTWNLFAPHYIEMVKSRARGAGFTESDMRAARYTLHKVLSVILRLLAPIIPFITEYLWGQIYSSDSIHVQRFPDYISDDMVDGSLTESVVSFNSMIWNRKKSAKISLKDTIHADIPSELEAMSADLRAMHHIV